MADANFGVELLKALDINPRNVTRVVIDVGGDEFPTVTVHKVVLSPEDTGAITHVARKFCVVHREVFSRQVLVDRDECRVDPAAPTRDR